MQDISKNAKELQSVWQDQEKVMVALYKAKNDKDDAAHYLKTGKIPEKKKMPSSFADQSAQQSKPKEEEKRPAEK